MAPAGKGLIFLRWLFVRGIVLVKLDVDRLIVLHIHKMQGSPARAYQLKIRLV
jgi:hypothetical protein